MSAAAQAQTTGHRDGKIIPVALAASVQIWKGAAASIVLGTGYGTPLVPGTVNQVFIGVWGESLLEPTGTAGSTFTQVVRQGLFSFGQTGTTITAASLNEPVYFSDDHTVTLTEGNQLAGVVAAVDKAGNVWVDISNAVRSSAQAGKNWISLSGSTDAINPHVEANYIILSTGVDAATLAAPTATTDDGVEIFVSSNTAHAHTITAPGLLQTGASAVNVATFAAHAGAGVRLKAYQGLWNVMYSTGITFS